MCKRRQVHPVSTQYHRQQSPQQANPRRMSNLESRISNLACGHRALARPKYERFSLSVPCASGSVLRGLRDSGRAEKIFQYKARLHSHAYGPDINISSCTSRYGRPSRSHGSARAVSPSHHTAATASLRVSACSARGSTLGSTLGSALLCKSTSLLPTSPNCKAPMRIASSS